MSRRTRLVALAVGLAVALAFGGTACTAAPASPPSPTMSPLEDPATSAPPGPPAAAPPTTVKGAGPFDDEGADLHLGSFAADDAEEQAVADAWIAYWTFRLPAYHRVEVDEERLGEVARGQAADTVREYVAYLRANGLRTVGDIRIGLSDIRIEDDDFAGVTGCLENRTVDRDASGIAAEELTPFAQHLGILEKIDGRWIMTHTETVNNEGCSAE